MRNEWTDAPVRRTGKVPQDLHIHTTFSKEDSAVASEQTVQFVASVAHAECIGISDHFESLIDPGFDAYAEAVRSLGLRVGTEVNGPDWVADAARADAEYYVYHCHDRAESYDGARLLLDTGKPVIVAHPMMLDTNLARVPKKCLIEINNRYVWRDEWRSKLGFYRDEFRFVIGSDAHQPHWLNQNIARWVASELGVRETLLFPPAGSTPPA